MTLQAGFQIGGRYKILKLIGYGWMSTMYLTEDQINKTLVAVKVMDPRLSIDQMFVQRLQQEANIAKCLDHPNIPKVFEWGVEGEYFYLAMEYVQGKTLRQILCDEKVLDLSTSIELMCQILQSLSYAYSMGVKAHKDIKPDNIMIESKTQRVKMMDFGIAKMEGSLSTDSTKLVSSHYTAPEQLLPQRFTQGISSYTDLYTLAMIFYEMLSGRAPFYGESTLEAVQQQPKKKFPPIHVLCPYLPIKLQDFFKKALSPQPQNRYQAPEEMMRDLDAFITNNKIQYPEYASKPKQFQDKPAPKKYNTAFIYSAFIFLALVLTVGSVLIVRSAIPAFQSFVARNSVGHSVVNDSPSPPLPEVSQARGNSVGNIVNDGKVAQQDDWVYYRNSSDDGKLYKIRTDETGRTKLNEDDSRYLNVFGEWIYYSNYSNKGELYKIRTDGTGREKLNEDRSDFLNVLGEWVYYTYSIDSRIYKIRTDGTRSTKLNRDWSSSLNVVGEWIYYRNNNFYGNLYKIRTDGSGCTKLNGDDSRHLNVLGEWIYYQNDSDGGKIYKIRTDGMGKTKLNEDKSWYLNVLGEWVYYRNLSNDGKLYKIRTDGRGRTKLNDDDSWHLNVVGEWIYYRNLSDDYKLYKIRTDGSERQKVN